MNEQERADYIHQVAKDLSDIYPEGLIEWLQHPGDKWHDKRHRAYAQLQKLEQSMNVKDIQQWKFINAVTKWEQAWKDVIRLCPPKNPSELAEPLSIEDTLAIFDGSEIIYEDNDNDS